ncbi:MAG: DUF2330 domain-containing protein [Myxococcaceae bacterium]|nr:DUF2330 domain-containing protein [Myxococcaceae bacterium]
MSRLLVSLAALAVSLAPSLAEACGCFAVPNPTVPVVQAGERIIFAVKNGQVTAHVQVLYNGANGQEFGWLVPLPAVPTIQLGADEVFAVLNSGTQPRYQVNRSVDSSCQLGGLPGAGGGTASGNFAGGSAGGSPLVVQDSVGPYDYAVLRSDSKDEMLAWLMANRYFVPATSDSALAPYIRPGGYFLALKLRPGNDTGDLQPIVMKYQSDYGQIPLTLTSIGAVQDMGVQVFLLAAGRGIPRNYHHTVINDAQLDWLGGAGNYASVITRAVGEAPGKHSFVTEFAGSPEPLVGGLGSTLRFGSKAQFAALPTPEDFVEALYANGFQAQQLTGGLALPGPLKGILSRYLPPPQGVPLDVFYARYRSMKAMAPPQDYQPQAMADAIWERVVTPVLDARALLADSPILTRLFTTISPADMNKDPAFSFNPTLPNVSNNHVATLTTVCGTAGTRQVLTTEQGWTMEVGGSSGIDLAKLPASWRTELLREEGGPEVLTDNTALLKPMSPTPPMSTMFTEPLPKKTGCAASGAGDSMAVLLALVMLVTLRRR